MEAFEEEKSAKEITIEMKDAMSKFNIQEQVIKIDLDLLIF